MIEFIRRVLYIPPRSSGITRYDPVDELFILGSVLGYTPDTVRQLPVDVKSTLVRRAIKEKDANNKFRRVLIEAIVKSAGGKIT